VIYKKPSVSSAAYFHWRAQSHYGYLPGGVAAQAPKEKHENAGAT